MATNSVSEDQTPVAATAVSAIANAYYSAGVAAGNASRSRAQAGYGVASALALALLGVGVFADGPHVPLAAQIVGLLSLVLWVISAGLYMHAVSAPVEVVSDVGDAVNDADRFVIEVLTGASIERKEIDRRERCARLVALGALILMLGAFLIAYVGGQETNRVQAVVQLRAGASGAQSLVCGDPGGSVTGNLDIDTLDEPFVDVEATSGGCDEIRTLIPSSLIAVVEIVGPSHAPASSPATSTTSTASVTASTASSTTAPHSPVPPGGNP